MEYSDHHPILVIPFNVYHHNMEKQFKFENAWNLVESYHDMLSNVWTDDRNFEECLKDTKDNLKNWKEQSFESVKMQKKEIISRLKGV